MSSLCELKFMNGSLSDKTMFFLENGYIFAVFWIILGHTMWKRTQAYRGMLSHDDNVFGKLQSFQGNSENVQKIEQCGLEIINFSVVKVQKVLAPDNHNEFYYLLIAQQLFALGSEFNPICFMLSLTTNTAFIV